MARGSKDYDKVVRKVNKGHKSKAKINSIQKMVEAMINGDTDSAEEELSEYIRIASRSILLGEAADEDEEDDSSDGKMTDDKDDDDDSDDDDSDDDSDDDDSDDDSDDEDDDDSDDDSEKKITEDVTDDKSANLQRALTAVLKKLEADKSGRQSIDTNKWIVKDDIKALKAGKATEYAKIERDILKAEKALNTK